MDFDELKVLWDSQKGQPMYVLDRSALDAIVRRRARSADRSVSVFELTLVAIALVLAAYFALPPLFTGEDLHELVGAGLLLVSPVYLLIHRARRRRREQRFDASVLGELQRALSQVDYTIARLRAFAWWYTTPVVLMMVVSFAAKYESMQPWRWVAMALLILAVVTLCHFAIRVELRCKQFPRQRSLEALRDKLTHEG